MKCEIICLLCTNESQTLYKTNNPYPNEYLKYVDGLAKQNFVCDHCGREIEIGSRCTAYTISLGKNDYRSWEGEYINYKNG